MRTIILITISISTLLSSETFLSGTWVCSFPDTSFYKNHRLKYTFYDTGTYSSNAEFVVEDKKWRDYLSWVTFSGHHGQIFIEGTYSISGNQLQLIHKLQTNQNQGLYNFNLSEQNLEMIRDGNKNLLTKVH